MLDITFKYKRQLSEVINHDSSDFIALGRKHRAEFELLREKQKEEIIKILDDMEEEFLDLSEGEVFRIRDNMDDFLISLLKQIPYQYWDSYWDKNEQ